MVAVWESKIGDIGWGGKNKLTSLVDECNHQSSHGNEVGRVMYCSASDTRKVDAGKNYMCMLERYYVQRHRAIVL